MDISPVSQVQAIYNVNQNLANNNTDTTQPAIAPVQQPSLPDQSQSQDQGTNSNSNGQQQQPTAQQLQKIQSRLNQVTQAQNVSVQLAYDQAADQVVMTFVDENNNQVVKKVPSDSELYEDVQIKKFMGLLFEKFI